MNDVLRRNLETLGISQEGLALIAGASRRTVGRWVAGSIPRAWALLRWVCLATGVSADVFLGLRQCSCGRTIGVGEAHCKEG